MSFVFAPRAVAVPVPAAPTAIPCAASIAGRNYAAHAREMGFDPDREPPFFCKPADAVVPVA